MIRARGGGDDGGGGGGARDRAVVATDLGRDALAVEGEGGEQRERRHDREEFEAEAEEEPVRRDLRMSADNANDVNDAYSTAINARPNDERGVFWRAAAPLRSTRDARPKREREERDAAPPPKHPT